MAKRSWLQMDTEAASAQNAMGACTVKLNVGGQYFDVATSTLSRLEYFSSYLEGRIGFSVSADGRIFIDRDGFLFSQMLQYLRTGQRPSEGVISLHRQSLLEECDFYGLDSLAAKIRGQTSAWDLQMRDQAMRVREQMAKAAPDQHGSLLCNVFDETFCILSPEALQLPLLFQRQARAVHDKAVHGRPAIRGNYLDFSARMADFTCGLSAELRSVEGAIVAGGAVLAALTGAPAGDLDIFLLGPLETAEVRLRQIFSSVQRVQARCHGAKTKILVTRSKMAVTMLPVHDTAVLAPPVQVITHVYSCLVELLVQFDIDCCCFAWVPGKEQVLCTPRGRRALEYNANVVDSIFASPSYFQRLEKYVGRGFHIALPGFEPCRLSARLLSASYIYMREYDLLLEVEPKKFRGSPVEIDILHFVHLQATRCTTAKVKASSTQEGRAVKGMARLVVMDTLQQRIRNVQTPQLEFCDDCARFGTMQAALRNSACLVMTDKNVYTLLWGTDEAISHVFEESPSSTPLAHVYRLLKHKLEREHASSCEVSQGEDACWKGGIMHRLACAANGKVAAHALEEDLAQRMLNKEPCLFVYDFCNCGTDFDRLEFIRGVGRSPLLQAGPEEFQDRFGIPKTLSFTAPPCREPVNEDWWADIYA